MYFNERLKNVRKEKGLTQADLAEKAGISINSVRLYESGKITPKVETLQKIADALEVPWLDLYPDDTARTAAMKSLLAIGAELENQFENMKKGFPATDLNIETSKELAHRADLLKEFDKLNEAGKHVAVWRVHELTEIPAYQRPTDSPQDAPTATNDKDPDKK